MKDRVRVAWHRLIASDPGLTRLELALRVVVTTVLALGVLAGLMRWAGLATPAVFVGTVVALIGSAMVNDARQRARQITTSLLPLSAAGAVALAAVLAPWPLIADAVFVGVCFAAVYVRRYGPRGFALGMIAFITYFIALFLQLRLPQWPVAVGGAAIGTACAFAVRFGLFSDRRERRVRALLRSFYACVGQLLDDIGARTYAASDRDDRRRLRWLILQLNDTALTVDAELEASGATARRDTGQMPPALALFDLELAIERLAAASRERLGADDRTAVIRTLRALRATAVARHRGQADAPIEAPRLSSYRWEAALRDIARALAGAPSADSIEFSATRATTAPAQTRNDAPAPQLPATTRQAIQVATAAGLAIGAGQWVSPQRWYWAAITAFVVFAGTSSRGETLSKGWQRVVGTCAGVAAGIVLTLAVGSHRLPAIALILVCLFLAFYLIQVSYGLMIFWITIALALLYGLMGRFSVQLLELRLVETVIGAAIGAIVASVVLPMSTRVTVRAASADYLDTLASVIEHSAARLAGDDDTVDPTTEARRLDRDFQRLRGAALPLTRGLAGAFGRRGARGWLRALLACRHYARQLAQHGQQASPAGPDTALARALTAAAAEVTAEIRALRAGEPPAKDIDITRTTTAALDRAGHALRSASPALQAAARDLRRIHRLTLTLRHDFVARRRRA